MNKVTILIPAHNEEKIIKDVLTSIYRQTHTNINIVVVCDNCTDETIPLIRQFDNENNKRTQIYKTKDNTARKAGAINQAIHHCNIGRFLLIMDADTILGHNCIEEGLKMLYDKPELGAVCSRAHIIPISTKNIFSKILWHLQHIEYGQFDAERVETHGRIKVAHGMCTLFRRDALFNVPNVRIEKTGNDTKCIFLEDNLVEDYEMTLNFKHDWEICMCLNMKAWTDVPTSLKEFYIQRLRWLRGGVDTLRIHGINKITYRDILNHGLFVITTIMKSIIYFVLIITIIQGNLNILHPLWWVIITLATIDSTYRLKYMDRIYFSDVLIKFLFIPEILYNWYQAYILLVAIIKSYLNIDQKW